MRRLMSGLWLWVALAGTVWAQPFPDAVQVNGGWVPCTHPMAIAAGLGCGAGPPPPAVQPMTSPLVAQRYYRATGGCLVRTLAIAVTHLHQRPMMIAECVSPAWCEGVGVLYFDPARPPDQLWVEVPASDLGVDW